jgi:O-acetyl-ADP-ribose deacetylase (regulator of RNase III)
MIYQTKGDLLESDCNVIAHQCNCYKNMGAGIALQIKNKYPQAFQADCDLTLSADNRFGKMSFAHCQHRNKDKNMYIFNLYGQKRWGSNEIQTKYDKLEESLNLMFKEVLNIEKEKGTLKVGVPYLMGCDRAGGDWNKVNAILQKVSETYQHDIYVYEFNPGRR